MNLEESVGLCARLLDFFEEKEIPVIRLGLHDGADLREGCVAGPWHPAFRELCESRRYFEKISRQLESFPAGSAFLLRVHPAAVSQLIGQKKQNLLAWKTRGYSVTVRQDAACAPGKVAVEKL